MSRYQLHLIDMDVELVLGWDPGLDTFFAQLYCPDTSRVIGQAGIITSRGSWTPEQRETNTVAYLEKVGYKRDWDGFPIKEVGQKNGELPTIGLLMSAIAEWQLDRYISGEMWARVEIDKQHEGSMCGRRNPVLQDMLDKWDKWRKLND